jgi:hypothetical protein
MKNYYKRYFILAIIGSVIIGLAFYLFFNDYIDKEKILVAAEDIDSGTVISDDELTFREYYNNSLPEDYLLSTEKVVGKVINVDRKKNDFISADMLGQEKEDNSILSGLNEGDVLITIRIQHPEPILDELKKGDFISIVSTFRDDNFILENFKNGISIPADVTDTDLTEFNYPGYLSENYIKMNTIELSENIVSIDGQLIVRNLEVVDLDEDNNISSNSILINNDTRTINLYCKCKLEEMPIIARLTAEDKYKVIFEKI